MLILSGSRAGWLGSIVGRAHQTIFNLVNSESAYLMNVASKLPHVNVATSAFPRSPKRHFVGLKLASEPMSVVWVIPIGPEISLTSV